MVRQDNSFLQRSTHQRFGDLKETTISSVQDTTAKKKNKLLLSSTRSKVISQSEDQSSTIKLLNTPKAPSAETARSLENSHKSWVKELTKNPSLRIAVIGGGIYGCHFANVFKRACEEVSSYTNELIDAKLTIFEKDDMLFSQASGKNSFRIHKGFHYPRSGNTRRMCYADHAKFCLLYPTFFRTKDHARVGNVQQNQVLQGAFPKVFAIAKGEKTIIDYEACRNLLAGSRYEGGISMWNQIDGELWNNEISSSSNAAFMAEQMNNLGLDVDKIEGAFLVRVEPILFADEPRKWFTEQFTQSPFVELVMGKRVDQADVQESIDGDLLVHSQDFDFALNCSYNQAIPMQPKNHKTFYDLCLSVIVAEKPNHGRMPAISFGIFDGPFPSLEPYDFSSHENLPTELKKFETQNLFQIFDVELSSIATSCDAGTAYALMASWEEKKRKRSKDYEEAVQAVWDKCRHYYPRLGEDFEFAGSWFALKTKVEDMNASRPVIVHPDEDVDHKGRFIQVFSSKLTSIFKAEEEVLEILSSSQ